MRRLLTCAWGVGLATMLSACGGTNTSGEVSGPSTSEVAVSAVAGALNNSGGSAIGLYQVPRQRTPLLHQLLEGLSPIGRAYAASWTCSGGTFDPAFAGPGTYAFTPVSCSVTWGTGKTASSEWSGAFTLDYGSACDATHRWVGNQAAGCEVTRTTPAGGDTRTITGPNGWTYAITHDTHGAGTGWDAGVSPPPTDDGVVVACASAGGCATDGGTLTIHGSHLTGAVTPTGMASVTIWDHTVSTGASPLTFTGTAAARSLSGTVTVQHNLAHYTATSTFDAVTFGDPQHCCFPTAGSVSTAFLGGPAQGKTETLTFGAQCGEATLTTAAGSTVSVTLQHCL